MRRRLTVGLLALAGVVVAMSTYPAAQSSRMPGVPAHTVDRPCEHCHDMTPDISHPVGMRPTMVVPAAFPLDAAGRMACTTCHDVTMARPAQGPGDPSMLRGAARGSELCGACHADTRTLESRLSHALMIGRAHGGDAPASTSSAKATASTLPVDSQSLACMECHDGSLAPSDDVAVGGWQGAASGSSVPGPAGLGLSHPVGADYARLAINHRGLQPVAVLASGAVRLVEGRVGCTSCHSPFSTHAKLLVMTNTRSQLCLTCHHF